MNEPNQVTELLPCPFCPGLPAIETDGDEWDCSRVICRACGSMGPYAYHPDHDTVEAARKVAIVAWNTRPASTDAGSEYVTVPREPTEAMIAAWGKSHLGAVFTDAEIAAMSDDEAEREAASLDWSAMIDAAPAAGDRP